MLKQITEHQANIIKKLNDGNEYEFYYVTILNSFKYNTPDFQQNVKVTFINRNGQETEMHLSKNDYILGCEENDLSVGGKTTDND